MLLIYMSLLDTQEERDRFEYLYENYRYGMFYVARSILHNNAMAEDAVHDSFVRIMHHMKKIPQNPAEARGFLTVVVRNISCSMLRTASNIHEVQTESMETCTPDSRFDAEEIFLEKESIEHLSELISQLPESYSSVFSLKVGLGFSDKEIAELLNITENNVRIRFHRGRQQLMNRLRKERAGHEEAAAK